MRTALRPASAFRKPTFPIQGLFGPCYRSVHQSQWLRETAGTALPSEHQPLTAALPLSQQPSRPPLSLLPLKTVVRSYLINAVSSNNLLLAPSLRLLSLLAHSKSPFLDPDQNPLLRYLLKKTLYSQFCGGETRSEIQKTMNGLKEIGFAGVILAYAKEIVVHHKHDLSRFENLDDIKAKAEVESWKQGNLMTISLTGSGGFIGLKFTGAGGHALQLLAEQRPPSAMMDEATTEICEAAKASGVRLLFDAEQQAIQYGIDAWTLHFQRKYNSGSAGEAIVYGTYQAYLRSTPAILAEHLAIAHREGFRLGVKLVRGAYMASDPRHLFWATKEETDGAYDGITEALISRTYNDVLRPQAKNDGRIPEVKLVLATHNHATVKKAMSLRRQQTDRGIKKIDMVYGQLMGMADEVSCELVLAKRPSSATGRDEKSRIEGPRAFKYLVWGSVGECTKYLLRRAEENRDAVLRAKETRAALFNELHRRLMS